MYMWAGVAFFASDRHTFRSIHFPYPQYATPYSPIVTTTHRNGVDRMSTTVPPPPRTPCEELPRVFLSDRLNITFSGLGRRTGAPQHRPNPPLTAHKTHTPVRPFQNRGDTTPEGPAPRAASRDPETVRACLCPALHEP